jgi:hypothetical protein
MSLTLVPGNGMWEIAGVGPGPGTAPLGRQAFHVGAHWVGFDDRFAEPVIVRAYYDPLADPAYLWQTGWRPFDYVGYLQFAQVTFMDMPIPPEVYGGRLADRQPYVYGPGHHFIDFMGPADANLYNIDIPVYPCNAYLTSGASLTAADLTLQPLPNGSLYSPTEQRANRSLVASLACEVAPGLILPSDIERFLIPDLGNRRLLSRYQVTATQLSGIEPYRFALNQLEAPFPSVNPDTLRGLDEGQIVAEVIGDYVLLTLPDPVDNFGPALCVSVRPPASPGGLTDIRVHLLSPYDTAGLRADAAREALRRIAAYATSEALMLGHERAAVPPPVNRGRGGLEPVPFDIPYASYPVAPYPVALRYSTVAVGIQTFGSPLWQGEFLSGFSWSAQCRYDDDLQLMTLSAIGNPSPLIGFDIASALRQYQAARSSPQYSTARVDPGNFTKTTMRRDNFGVGTQLTFIPDQAN